MGGSSAPTVYQQQQTDPATLAANKAANRQKEVALAEINQDVYARSQGLRGQSGLYQWAGPTPNMAANMDASNRLGGNPPVTPPAPSKPAPPTLADLQEKYNPGSEPVAGWGARKYQILDPKTLRGTGQWHYIPSLYQRAVGWTSPGRAGGK